MILALLRGLFLLLTVAVTVLYVLPFQLEGSVDLWLVLLMMGGALVIALGIITADVATPKKNLSALSGAFLGLIAGLVVAFALGKVVDLIGLFVPTPEGIAEQAYQNLLKGVKVFIGLITCYLGITLVLQTRDDFRFVIPYVEFTKQVRGVRQTLLDTSILIDGRITELVDTAIMQGSLVIPKFILDELQAIADSPDKLRRARGRRGLEVVQKLQEAKRLDVAIHDGDVDAPAVDQKLVTLAERLQARLMTNDYNLAKIAAVRGVDVINLNDLARAMRPVALPGEGLRVKIIKPGEAAGQGVGYLEDGTMIVVEDARHDIGRELEIQVTSTLQTSAGRMIFGRRVDVANART